MKQIFDVTDMKISNITEDLLNACTVKAGIEPVIYDPVVTVEWISNHMLPEFSINNEQAQSEPCMFAKDT